METDLNVIGTFLEFRNWGFGFLGPSFLDLGAYLVLVSWFLVLYLTNLPALSSPP